MKRVFFRLKTVLFRWLILIFVLFLIVFVCLIRARPIIISYAESHAKVLMVSAFDEAVKSSLNSLNYSYNDISVVTRLHDNTVSSIEIDYQKLNVLRSDISGKISEIAVDKSDNVLSIPLGTLIGNEYTTGYGPKLRFRMKFSQIPVLDFESKFSSAGINSVFHQIIIKAEISCSIIMLGADNSFSVSLSAIAAQTVIAGLVPESFTNVVETPDSNVADDIFNFSD